MDNVCIVSGELDGNFMGEATFNDHWGVNQSSGDDFVGKQPENPLILGDFSEKVAKHTLTTNWVRKRR